MKKLLFAFVIAACSTSAPAKDVTTTSATPSCPLGVEGATMSVEDTFGGIALTFMSPRVDEIRMRAMHASALRGPQAVGPGHEGRHGHGGGHGLQPLQLPPAYAGMDEVEGGARIRIYPADPADLELLRARVRSRAFAIGATPCEEPRR